MKAGIITIGDELLIGQTINTNSAWIGQKLSLIGIEVRKSLTIRDNREDILNALQGFLQEDVEIIIITGGLGPTNDDITKETLTHFFDTELQLNEKVLHHVRHFFEEQGKVMPEVNIQQAMFPKKAEIIENKIGTAPGMWFQKEGKDVLSIPGVPYEMMEMMERLILPKLTQKYATQKMYFETIMLQGIGESALAEKIASWENRIYVENFHLAYLPSPGLIRLRLSSENGSKENKLKIKQFIEELADFLPQYVYAKEELSIFEVVGKLLEKENKTVGTIESCTGGGIAHSFVQNSGASNYFKGGLITYSNALKHQLANVSLEILDKYGAVSKEVAIEMAKGGREILNTDYTIAVTGIAGPDGGSQEKPVGTVWMAIASAKGVVTEKHLFGKNRERNLIQTQVYAANLLRKVMLEIETYDLNNE